MNPLWFKVIFISLMLSISALSWLVKKLAEQRKIKQAREATDRHQDQMLRMGRSETSAPGSEHFPSSSVTTMPAPPTTHADARRKLQELAERRQRQLEELRRRQGSGQAAPALPSQTTLTESAEPVRPMPPVAPIPSMRPGSPAPIRTATPRTPPQRAQTARAPQQGKRAGGGGRTQAAKAKPQRVENPHAVEQAVREASAKARADQAMSAPVAPVAPQTEFGPEAMQAGVRGSLHGALLGMRSGNMTARDWRRVLMLREIFDKPVCQRDEHTNSILL